MWDFLYAVLLLANSLAVLNEQRFLVPYGLGFHQLSNGQTTPLKVQVVGLIHAVQYLRVPLIAANIVTIFFKLLFA
ncbi:hypothetical protein CLOM_g11029 [Closterium sp. NIES-68]|nr:hypothetical protein CLOM_g11029 [Closterium sp. NIES-68]GJP59121.1 hypothetical protein CLOP_g8322 [Closterium sp. NIES-67]